MCDACDRDAHSPPASRHSIPFLSLFYLFPTSFSPLLFSRFLMRRFEKPDTHALPSTFLCMIFLFSFFHFLSSTVPCVVVPVYLSINQSVSHSFSLSLSLSLFLTVISKLALYNNVFLSVVSLTCLELICSLHPLHHPSPPLLLLLPPPSAPLLFFHFPSLRTFLLPGMKFAYLRINF